MKKIICFIWLAISFNVFPQADLIQSIDFDSHGRVVFGLTGPYDYSYVKRLDDGEIESWNLTEQYNLVFQWISTTVDNDDNIWAYMDDKVYKFDGISWSAIPLPFGTDAYMKYSDLSIHNNYLWLSAYHGYYGIWRLNLSNFTWEIIDSTKSSYPTWTSQGPLFHSGDSTWVPTNKGLVMIYQDTVEVLDKSNSAIPTEHIYSFYIDSKGNKWIGTMDSGLVQWVDNSTFITYNSDNSSLPNNFINAIDEDSEGTLWLATDQGFACVENDSVIYFKDLFNEPIAALAVDSYDRIWMGSVGTGKLVMFNGNNIQTLTDIYADLPDQMNFVLLQNYPNPFNPATKIKYSVPSVISNPVYQAKNPFVSLKVFDMLGKEITTLVSEEKLPGEYEVEFDAGTLNLSSGVYYYKMSYGSFTSAKKMILLK